MTRIENYVKQMEDQDIGKIEYENLQVRSTDLTSLFEKFNDAQEKIEAFQEIAEDIDERSAVEAKYYTIKAMISSLIQNNQDTPQFKPKKMPIAMPTLNIPQFNGDIKNWPIFKNLFFSVIDGNEDLPKLQKLHYLKSFLEGEAAALISSLILSEENYEKALEILTKSKVLIH
ncbi:uncharacterized protein isoform X2 [Choristoneura fumiferana]|uniref:uncharacterized protein isoform X2 n=1 Tax=Choristoneura fumiferana TaxID=7141 RepID=UPI003D15D187